MRAAVVVLLAAGAAASPECLAQMEELCPGLGGQDAECRACAQSNEATLRPLCQGTGSARVRCNPGECVDKMDAVCPGLRGAGAECQQCIAANNVTLAPFCRGSGDGIPFCGLAECNRFAPATVTSDSSELPAPVAVSTVASIITRDSSTWQLHYPADSAWLRCGFLYALHAPADEGVAAGATISINCTEPVCDAFLFVHHQPPVSGEHSGLFATNLPPDWESGSCAPQFNLTNGTDGCLYPMVTYRRLIRGFLGEVVTITTDTFPATYTALVVTRGADCTENPRSDPAGNAQICEAEEFSGGHSCMFVDGECVDAWCPRRFGSTGAPAGSNANTSAPAVGTTGTPTGAPAASTGAPVASTTGTPVAPSTAAPGTGTGGSPTGCPSPYL